VNLIGDADDQSEHWVLGMDLRSIGGSDYSAVVLALALIWRSGRDFYKKRNADDIYRNRARTI
jgi:hypothetical protein